MNELIKFHQQNITELKNTIPLVVVFLLIIIGVLGFAFFQSNSEKTEVISITKTEKENLAIITIEKSEKNLSGYVEVIDSCNPDFENSCLNVRSGPGKEHPVITQLREGVVLKIKESVKNEGYVWYKIEFDEWLRYPERVPPEWYIASDYVKLLPNNYNTEEGVENFEINGAKKIIVSVSEQMLYAYENNNLFFETPVSTGIELTPTPYGTFTIFRKTPSRYMQGPIEGITEKYYDLPGVPWNLYFTQEGAVIHGTYWHNNFGKPSSNGCVNLSVSEAKKLYTWADIGTSVIVKY